MEREYINDGKELGCRWHFAPMNGGREDGPNDAMQQNFKNRPYSALLREAVQNSLDAVLDINKPVKVEISFSRLSSRNFNNFFELKKHIKECASYFGWNEKAKEMYTAMAGQFDVLNNGEIAYIRISDTNTCGMKYDPNSSASPFYAFARAVGVSSKIGQQSGGSFGFGKSAYFQLSPISTVFISTKTGENQFVFEGVSWLCSHEYKGQKVSSVGYYDNNGGNPIVIEEEIPVRLRRKDVGTHFYILGFNPSDTKEAIKEMKDETLRSFWLAIYERKLEIKIDDHLITYENLEDCLNQCFEEDIDDTRKTGYLNPKPYFCAVRDADGNHPHSILFTESLPILGECKLYLVKTTATKDKIVYMRRPLMLVFAKRTQTSYGAYGVFVCANPHGDEILRSLENPSHDEWKASNWRDKDYKIVSTGTDALQEIYDFIQRCFKDFFANNQESALDITGLDELLYIPEDLLDNSYESPLASNPTGEIQSEGVSLTTDITPKNMLTKDDGNANVGAVRIIETGSSNEEEEDDDSEDAEVRGIGGHTLKRSKRKGGQPTAGDTFVKTKISERKGTYRTFLPVHFRVVAIKEDDIYYHHLIIHSPKDVINGELELVTIGEQTDDIVDVTYTDNGTIHDNFISNVILEEGRNTIKILFKDNMRHTIKLRAYENQ